ncbi:MAG TPA: sugar transferase [Herbinix luporum]|nr:sugar transferase [Herbinix luporum]
MKVIGEGVIVRSSSTIRETYDEKIYYSVSGSNALKEDADKRYIKVNGKEHKLYFAIKRIMDIILSFLGLIILSPIFLITAIAIRLESKGKVIFSQTRTGKDGKEFKMYKFRSMCEDAEKLRSSLLDQNKMDGPVFKIVEDPRVTKVGHFIRKTSIDELPQLINILKGDMSIVGPRPLVTYETSQFSDYENQRHQVKPGLTCYWQISGRNDIPFSQWIKLDIKYLEDMSLWTDVKIIFLTIKVVLTGKGAY